MVLPDINAPPPALTRPPRTAAEQAEVVAVFEQVAGALGHEAGDLKLPKPDLVVPDYPLQPAASLAAEPVPVKVAKSGER